MEQHGGIGTFTPIETETQVNDHHPGNDAKGVLFRYEGLERGAKFPKSDVDPNCRNMDKCPFKHGGET